MVGFSGATFSPIGFVWFWEQFSSIVFVYYTSFVLSVSYVAIDWAHPPLFSAILIGAQKEVQPRPTQLLVPIYPALVGLLSGDELFTHRGKIIDFRLMIY